MRYALPILALASFVLSACCSFQQLPPAVAQGGTLHLMLNEGQVRYHPQGGKWSKWQKSTAQPIIIKCKHDESRGYTKNKKGWQQWEKHIDGFEYYANTHEGCSPLYYRLTLKAKKGQKHGYACGEGWDYEWHMNLRRVPFVIEN